MPGRTGTPRIVIYDTITGRVAGGHQADYLAALEQALADLHPQTYAPFRDSPAAVSVIARIRGSIAVVRQVLDAPTPELALVPNATSLDYIACALALATRVRGGRGGAVFVMRRDAAGITGPGWRAAILDWIVRAMARSRDFHMISDARVAMDYWTARTGRKGAIVSIPLRLSSRERRAGAALALGLIGLFRLEKGGAHYGLVIETARRLWPQVRIVCQTSHSSARPQEAEMVRQLAARWQGDMLVEMHPEHLDADAFTDMLHELDVVVLPYDVPSYGPGTSGILFEAVAAGKVVLAAPIAWAHQEYDGHPNVVWLAGTDCADIEAGLAIALDLAARRRNEPQVRQEDRFQSSWLKALTDISEDRAG